MATGVLSTPAYAGCRPRLQALGVCSFRCASLSLSVIGRLASSLSPSVSACDRLTTLPGLPLLIGQSISLLMDKTISTQAPWVQRRSWLAAQLHILGLHGI